MLLVPKINPAMMAIVETSIADYQKANPDDSPELDNEAWANALTSSKSKVPHKATIQRLTKAGQGQIIDLYQTPVKLRKDKSGWIEVISAGKDGVGTEDDVTGEPYRTRPPSS